MDGDIRPAVYNDAAMERGRERQKKVVCAWLASRARENRYDASAA